MKNLNYHKAKCQVCASEKCKEFEEQYLKGIRPGDLQYEFGFELRSIYRHISAFELDKKRDNSTLAIVNQIVDRIPWSKLKIDNLRNAMMAIELRSKLLGEIVTKHEVKEVLDELPSDELEKLAEQSAEIVKLRKTG